MQTRRPSGLFQNNNNNSRRKGYVKRSFTISLHTASLLEAKSPHRYTVRSLGNSRSSTIRFIRVFLRVPTTKPMHWNGVWGRTSSRRWKYLDAPFAIRYFCLLHVSMARLSCCPHGIYFLVLCSQVYLFCGEPTIATCNQRAFELTWFFSRPGNYKRNGWAARRPLPSQVQATKHEYLFPPSHDSCHSLLPFTASFTLQVNFFLTLYTVTILLASQQTSKS